MFAGCADFVGDLSKWDTKSVKKMDEMFKSASKFNTDISGWDVGNVENMNEMFTSARSFNQDISRWNVRKLEKLRRMFEGASSFNQDLCLWSVLLPENAYVGSQMFVQTACNTWGDPDLQLNGPFCHACTPSNADGGGGGGKFEPQKNSNGGGSSEPKPAYKPADEDTAGGTVGTVFVMAAFAGVGYVVFSALQKKSPRRPSSAGYTSVNAPMSPKEEGPGNTVELMPYRPVSPAFGF